MRDFPVKQVQAAEPGRHRVSQSLYLHVSPNGRTRRFIFRFTKPSTGRVTEMGLGGDDVMTLAEARAKVHEARRMVARGEDPIETKRGARTASITFADMVSDYLAVAERRMRNPRSVKNVRLLLMKHASKLADMPISRIGAADVNGALRPLWLESPDQARRTVAACLRVIAHAKAMGHETASVGDMRDNMRHLFPPVKGEKRRFAALDYRNVRTFVRELRAAQTQGDALSPAVIEFIVLTAARESEVCGMQWSEVNWTERVWTLPPERSKTNTEHRVPLTDRALVLLSRQRGPSVTGEPADPEGYVWPGRNGDGPVTGKSVYKYLTQTMGLDATIHGLRSSFRDWAGDMTHYARNDIEECLSHAVGDATERAYRRSDALEKRREIMAAWSEYCSG
jgi:integrase